MARGRKKIFNFLGLPRELRDIIYSHYLVLIIRNRKTGETWIIRESFPNGEIMGKHSSRAPLNRHRRDHSLILINKQIHAEYLEVAYKRSLFTFDIQKKNLWELANWVTPPLLLANIRQCNVHFHGIQFLFTKITAQKKATLKKNLESFVLKASNLQLLRFYGTRRAGLTEPSALACCQTLEDVFQMILTACNRNISVRRVQARICEECKEYERVGSDLAIQKHGKIFSAYFTHHIVWVIKTANGLEDFDWWTL
jgi:hypothetical protein